MDAVTNLFGLVTTGIVGPLTISKTGTTARTATFPDAAITVAGSASALTSGRVPFATTGGLLADNGNFTIDTANGILSVANGATGSSISALRGSGSMYLDFDHANAGTGSLYIRARAEGDTVVTIPASAGGAINLARPVTCTGAMTLSLASGAGLTVSSTTAATAYNAAGAVFAGGIGAAGNSIIRAKVAFGSSAAIAPYHDLAVTGLNSFGCRAIGNGCDLSILSNGQGGGLFSNWYYNAGDKAAYLGYCPKFEMITSDGSIRLSTTAATVAADAAPAWAERMRIYATGEVACFSTTDATTTSDGSVRLSGGLSVAAGKSIVAGAKIVSVGATSGIGYATGAGGTVTQATSRATGVTLSKVTGQITLFTAAGSATPATFVVTNTAVAATDTVIINDVSGSTNVYFWKATPAAGSFTVTFWTTGGTASDTPVIQFNVIKGVTA